MHDLIRQTFQRARKERVAQLAGSLTLTTLLAVVPLVAVSFALFTRFPIFRRVGAALDAYVLHGLLPAELSRTVLRYLDHFAANAGSLTWLGLLLLPVTAVMLLLTVENAFNQVWRVKKGRPLLRRIGTYLLMLTLGPLLLGLVLWAMSTVIAMSLGLIGPLPRALSFVVGLGPFLLGVAAMTALFHYLPNAKVTLRDAFIGGLIASAAFELGKHAFTAWILRLPTYKALYGAFATVPLLLLWTYFSWLVTLLAAMLVASLAKPRRGSGGTGASRAARA